MWDISEAKASTLIKQLINYDGRLWGRGLSRNIPSHCFGTYIRLTLVRDGLHISCCPSTSPLQQHEFSELQAADFISL